MTETKTQTLTDFLLARFMDDEETCAFAPVGTYRMERLDGREERREADAQKMMDYVHRFQPDWMMQDVRAKRKIVALHAKAGRVGQWPKTFGPEPSQCESGCGHPAITGVHGPQPFPCATLRALALPYAEHPDYNPEWRPLA